MHVNPIADNDQIRITIPSLNQERREELVKIVKQKIEAGKAMLRQTRVELKKTLIIRKIRQGYLKTILPVSTISCRNSLMSIIRKWTKLNSKKQKELITI